FAQYVVVPANRAHPVPDALSDDAAAMIEPLAVAVHAAGKADIGPGTRVLVTGGGPVGLLCLQVARARGAGHVTVSDPVERRRAVARDFGADAVLDPSVQTAEDVAPVGAVRLDDMVTSHHDLDGAVDALLAARLDPDAIKAVVRPG